ncbi:MAG: NPCBM/NEW2 domain-containing protein [Oscillospiraceae bacterium]|jgi:hypothetical protein|nr:NPCBM/NEW2 domain-containing protein [Oscillospiraceae bacterium]
MKRVKSVLTLAMAVLLASSLLCLPALAETVLLEKAGGDGIFLSDLEWKSWYMFQSSSDNPDSPYAPSFDVQENGITPITISGISYAKGLRYHPDELQAGNDYSWCDIVYDVGSLGKTRFYAVVGKDSVGAHNGNIQFQVIGDGNVILESPILGPMESYVMDCDITGISEITLRANDGGDGITDDSCAWADAQVYSTNRSIPQRTAEELADGVYISDLEWKSWTMFGPSSSDNAESPYAPSVDTEENGTPIVIGGVHYPKGLRTHPDNPAAEGEQGIADFVYDIGGLYYTRFRAVVGKDSVGSVGHNIQFQVFGDGELLYETPVLDARVGHAIDVDVTGIQELTLRASDGGDGIPDDSCAWGNPRLTDIDEDAAAAAAEPEPEPAPETPEEPEQPEEPAPSPAADPVEPSVAPEPPASEPADDGGLPGGAIAAIIIGVIVVVAVVVALVIKKKKK